MASAVDERLVQAIAFASCFAAILWYIVFILRKHRRKREQDIRAEQQAALVARAQLQARAQTTLQADRVEQGTAAVAEATRYSKHSGTEDRRQGIVSMAHEKRGYRPLEPANDPLKDAHANNRDMGADVTYAARLCPMSFEQLLRYGIHRQPYLAVALMCGIGFAFARAISPRSRPLKTSVTSEATILKLRPSSDGQGCSA